MVAAEATMAMAAPRAVGGAPPVADSPQIYASPALGGGGSAHDMTLALVATTATTWQDGDGPTMAPSARPAAA